MPSPPAITVLAPMTMELRAVVRALRLSRSRSSGTATYTGTVAGAAITATRIGVGPAMAARTTERVLTATAPHHVLVCGIAGGVDPSLDIGAVIDTEVVLDATTQQTYRPHVTGISGAAARGTLLTTDGLMLDTAALAELAGRGVIAVDMETAAVARVCTDRGTPWSVVRAVSDQPGGGVIDEFTLDLLKPDGTSNVRAALGLVARHPTKLSTLRQMLRDGQAAARAAARAAAALVPELGSA